MIACVQTAIRTEHFSNADVECHCYETLLEWNQCVTGQISLSKEHEIH